MDDVPISFSNWVSYTKKDLIPLTQHSNVPLFQFPRALDIDKDGGDLYPITAEQISILESTYPFEFESAHANSQNDLPCDLR
jgi:hypothetical protein